MVRWRMEFIGYMGAQLGLDLDPEVLLYFVIGIVVLVGMLIVAATKRD